MILSKCVRLKDHIMFCMGNFTTFIMCGDVTRQGVELCIIVGVTIVEQTMHMTKGTDCTLIHYISINPSFCRKYLGAAMLKMIMNQPEYDNRKIVAVTSLSRYYTNVLSYDSIGDFFETLFFNDIN